MSGLILIVPLVLTFSIVVWNMYLPVTSYKNSEFLNYINYLFVKGYKHSDFIQQYIDKPIVQPVGKYLTGLLASGAKQSTYELGPRLMQNDINHYVTLTFYVQYGNQQRLFDLLDLLDQYHVNKAVFFVEKRFMDEHEFIIKRIQASGYVVNTWNDLSGYNDRNYRPTVYQNVDLEGSKLLSNVNKDRDAKEFLNAALHYRNASIIAFSPKIMSHQIVLEEILKQNGIGLVFTDANDTKSKTLSNQNYISNVSSGLNNWSPKDSFVRATQLVGNKSFSYLRISDGIWTMESLQKKHPSVISYLAPQSAFLISKPLVVGKNAELKITNNNIFLKDSHEKATPVFIEFLGKGLIFNSKISSWDPAINAPSPDPYNHRPYLIVKEGKLDILNSTLTHLGYSIGGLSDTRLAYAAVGYYNSSNFTIANSTIAFNYYGFYSEGSHNFRIINNDIYGQTKYGLDPHSGSRNFVVVSNHVHDNGNQGIICSIQCENVTIANNVVDHNVEGIGLHWLTNSSLVLNNTITHNMKYGIFIQKQSIDNKIENNTVTNNRMGIGLLEGSNKNIITRNLISDNLIDEPIHISPDSKLNKINGNTFSSGNRS
jgi:parallel beta-helix repeat protein